MLVRERQGCVEGDGSSVEYRILVNWPLTLPANLSATLRRVSLAEPAGLAGMEMSMRDLEKAEITFVYGAKGGGKSTAQRAAHPPKKGKDKPPSVTQGAASQSVTSPSQG